MLIDYKVTVPDSHDGRAYRDSHTCGYKYRSHVDGHLIWGSNFRYIGDKARVNYELSDWIYDYSNDKQSLRIAPEREEDSNTVDDNPHHHHIEWLVPLHEFTQCRSHYDDCTGIYNSQPLNSEPSRHPVKINHIWGKKTVVHCIHEPETGIYDEEGNKFLVLERR